MPHLNHPLAKSIYLPGLQPPAGWDYWDCLEALDATGAPVYQAIGQVADRWYWGSGLTPTAAVTQLRAAARVGGHDVTG